MLSQKKKKTSIDESINIKEHLSMQLAKFRKYDEINVIQGDKVGPKSNTRQVISVELKSLRDRCNKTTSQRKQRTPIGDKTRWS